MSDHFLTTLPHYAATACDPAVTGLTCAVFVSDRQVRPAATLCREQGYHLEDVTVTEVQEGTLVIYHYDHFDSPARLSVLALAPNNTIDSVADIHSGADWHERECFDFYGTTFSGHPNLLPLLLPPGVETPPLKKADAAKVDLATLFPWVASRAESKEA